MNLFQFFLACVAMVGSMHVYHYWLGYDPMADLLINLNGPYVSIDSWSIVHVIWFAGLGWLFPNRLPTFMLYGVMWEALEMLLAMTALRDFWQERGINTVWDIWFNFMGYQIGDILNAVYANQPDPVQKAPRKTKTVKK